MRHKADEEWQARPRRCNFIARWLGHGSVRPPGSPASIRTFVEPTGSCLLAFSIAFGCCHLKRDLPLTVAGKFWSSHWRSHPNSAIRTSRCPNGFPGPSQLADPTVRSFSIRPLPAAASGGCWHRLRRLPVHGFVNLAGHPQVVQQHASFRATATRAFFFAPLPPARSAFARNAAGRYPTHCVQNHMRSLHQQLPQVHVPSLLIPSSGSAAALPPPRLHPR